MNKANDILIDVLAATDAIFRPLRRADWTPPAPGNIWEARERFAVAGVAVPGGGSGAARVAHHRSVANLVDSGLLKLCGVGHAGLTERGDATARALAGLPSVADAHAALREVILQARVADEGILTSELQLAGLQNYTDRCQPKLWEVSLTLGPALSRGWIESRSDVHGRAYYTPTDAGLDAATRDAPTLPENLPNYSNELNERYYSQTVAARAALRTQKPSGPGEVGPIPLPASLAIRKAK